MERNYAKKVLLCETTSAAAIDANLLQKALALDRLEKNSSRVDAMLSGSTRVRRCRANVSPLPGIVISGFGCHAERSDGNAVSPSNGRAVAAIDFILKVLGWSEMGARDAPHNGTSAARNRWSTCCSRNKKHYQSGSAFAPGPFVT